MTAASTGGNGSIARRGAPYAARAFAVATVWGVGALPAVLGLAPCPAARLFHVPCPGCGMTRAAHLFLRGDVAASIAMHPLAVPIAAATLAVALATVIATFARGAPTAIVEHRLGRATLWAFAALNVASIALWALRMAGLFGGPVPV